MRYTGVMKHLIAFCWFLVCSGMAWATSPIAEILCEPTEVLHDRLNHRFASERTATGLRGPEQIMEVWTDSRGDWTMVVTYATGLSCIVAMGEAWTPAPPRDPA
ncbi:hypothetical protein [Ruegeria marina]|uniref:Uncharacterized protein n=1 Tax=Ruegeria marina TaxID=639004 RepID=A0A1G6SB50_9RHOB|nr:hypothetical protein [Ruegeria marina]SDD14079.1 hypothetical protein SAMN04488239_105229 [Ruegeria marina]